MRITAFASTWAKRRTLELAAATALALSGAGCATVRPEQRAVLADPTMQFDSEDPDRRAREHVLENREGSSGGGSVKGGGCGCN